MPSIEPFRSILLDIDVTAPAHPALERAARLARNCGAKLTIAGTLNIPGVARRHLPPGVEEELIGLRRRKLEELAAGVTGVPTESTLLIGRPATALIQEVLRSGHDLLVRSHGRDPIARNPKPYGATDMEVLRQCPCPVMLAGPGAPAAHPRIVGAVNASTEEASEQALNVKIAEFTLLMARLERGSPSLLQAWSPFAEDLVRTYCTAEVFLGYVEEARQRTFRDLKDLAASLSSPLLPHQLTIRRGEPEEVIPELVVEQTIDLVVMGTVARKGIAGLLLGNTAERILRKLPCSVLVIKPDDFVSPVRPASAAG